MLGMTGNAVRTGMGTMEEEGKHDGEAHSALLDRGQESTTAAVGLFTTRGLMWVLPRWS